MFGFNKVFDKEKIKESVKGLTDDELHKVMGIVLAEKAKRHIHTTWPSVKKIMDMFK